MVEKEIITKITPVDSALPPEGSIPPAEIAAACETVINALKGESGNFEPILTWLTELISQLKSENLVRSFSLTDDKLGLVTQAEIAKLKSACQLTNEIITLTVSDGKLIIVTVFTKKNPRMITVGSGKEVESPQFRQESEPVQIFQNDDV